MRERDGERLTEQKPRRWWSPLRVQSMAGLSWPLQERLQASRPSTRTSASISPRGSSSKLDTEPQPATWHRAPALGGPALLLGSPSSPTAGPRAAERFSCRERPPPPSLRPCPWALGLVERSQRRRRRAVGGAAAFATRTPRQASPRPGQDCGLSPPRQLPGGISLLALGSPMAPHCPVDKTLWLTFPDRPARTNSLPCPGPTSTLLLMAYPPPGATFLSSLQVSA